MSRLRTAVALLLHVLLLHASVLGGGMACAPLWTGLGSAAVEVGNAAHDGMHDGMHGAPAHAGRPTTDRASGDAPSPPSEQGAGHAPTHCVTAAGCVVAAVASSAAADDALRSVRSVAEVGRVSLPPSVRAAPETPPPRA
jgi:hypothetical protein